MSALTSSQREALSKLLSRHRDYLSERLSGLQADVAMDRNEGNDEVTDRKDDAVAANLVTLSEVEQNLALNDLAQVKAAQLREADGSYGICVDCGDDIAYERLRAQPAAARCIRCQSKLELAGHGR